MTWTTIKRLIYSGLFSLLMLIAANADEKQPIEWVNPLIDTHDSRWFYFSSASRPFGMVNLSPDTRTEGSWHSGYLYGDENIRCFSHIHAWQLAGIPVMPITGQMTGHLGMDTYKSTFSHDDEIVCPGYHRVRLKKYDVLVELTSTTRVGFHRYHFPASEDAYVLFDTGTLLAHGPMLRSMVRVVDDREIEGMSLMAATERRRKNMPVFFVARFSQPMTAFGGWKAGEKGHGKQLIAEPVEKVAGREAGAFVRFTTSADKPLLMKVAISYTSVQGARRNLNAELAHWDFDRIVRESRDDWNSHLSRIKVGGGTASQKTKFYTDIWHTLQGKRIVSDADGAYMDMTGVKPQVRNVPLQENGEPRFAMYNFDSCWGSHWSLDILWPLLCPERMSDICKTMVEMYRHGGLIPRGPSGGNYTFVMIGDSAAPFITSAYTKGIRDFCADAALRGLVRNTRCDGGRYYGGYADKPAPRVYEEYTQKGYVSEGNNLEGLHGEAVTSLTLYNAYHDYCISQMARAVGRHDIAAAFAPGAENYKNVIWPEKQSAWVRKKDGGWRPDFKPVDNAFEQLGFCETSAAVSTFYVPHDAPGLARLLGGPEAAARKLESHFEAAAAHDFHLKGRRHASIMIDYANQDGFGAAHFFNRIGYPWLSQKWVRKVHRAALSGTDPYSGYNGDEDQGQIGALSALMAMGLFEFDGGSSNDPHYDLTAPIFDKVTIRLSPRYFGGKTFTIVAKNQAPDHPYIQSARWNGRPWDSCLFPHRELIKGGTLELTLEPHPNKHWGTCCKLPP